MDSAPTKSFVAPRFDIPGQWCKTEQALEKNPATVLDTVLVDSVPVRIAPSVELWGWKQQAVLGLKATYQLKHGVTQAVHGSALHHSPHCLVDMCMACCVYWERLDAFSIRTKMAACVGGSVYGAGVRVTVTAMFWTA